MHCTALRNLTALDNVPLQCPEGAVCPVPAADRPDGGPRAALLLQPRPQVLPGHSMQCSAYSAVDTVQWIQCSGYSAVGDALTIIFTEPGGDGGDGDGDAGEPGGAGRRARLRPQLRHLLPRPR